MGEMELFVKMLEHIERFFMSNMDLIVQLLAHIAVLAILFILIDKFVQKMRDKITSSTEDNSLYHLLIITAKIIKVIVALCILGSFMQCRGYSLTSVMTGLGITGLAIGFAAKEMISSILGSISIMTDKVYKTGDYVIINDVEGVVEGMNFRSTKIRTINNTLVTIPNNITADTVVQNRSDAEYFKLIETFGIEYDTPDDKIQRGLDILNDICEKDNEIQPGHKTLVSELGENAITLQLIADTNTNYWMEFLNIKDRIYKEVLKRFREEGINFAFPSRTVYVRNDEN